MTVTPVAIGETPPDLTAARPGTHISRRARMRSARRPGGGWVSLRKNPGATRFLWGRKAKGPSLGLPKPRLTTMQVFKGEAGDDE